jgi:endonuclease/exonuclease/phosphatase family metal-dependent hydrolase
VQNYKSLNTQDSGLKPHASFPETTKEWEKFLKKNLANKYPHSIFKEPDGKLLASGYAVFSKKKITEAKYIPSKAGWFAGWILDAESEIGNIQILNLHLKPITREKGKLDANAFKAVLKVHLGEVKEFFRHMKKDAPSIVLGDFNEGDNGDAVKWIREKGYTDALGEYDRKTHTWEWDVKGFTYKERLDHILYSKHFDSLDAKVIKIKSSDHYPVLGIFEKKSEK